MPGQLRTNQWYMEAAAERGDLLSVMHYLGCPDTRIIAKGNRVSLWQIVDPWLYVADGDEQEQFDMVTRLLQVMLLKGPGPKITPSYITEKHGAIVHRGILLRKRVPYYKGRIVRLIKEYCPLPGGIIAFVCQYQQLSTTEGIWESQLCTATKDTEWKGPRSTDGKRKRPCGRPMITPPYCMIRLNHPTHLGNTL